MTNIPSKPRPWITVSSLVIIACGILLLSGCGLPSTLVSSSSCQGSGKGYPNRVLRESAYSPTGDKLAVGYYGCNGGELEIWDTQNWQQQPTVIPAQAEEVYTLAFSPDNRWLAFGGSNGDGVVHVLDTSNLKASLVEFGGHQKTIRFVVFSPDSKKLTTVDLDNTLRVWDLNSPSQPIKTMQKISATDVTLSGDGKTLALSNSFAPEIELLNFADSKKASRKVGDKLNFTSRPVFSSDGRFMAAGVTAFDQPNYKLDNLLNPAVQIWDMADSQATPTVLSGQDCMAGVGISNAAFSPDDKWFAGTCVTQGLVQVWDLTNPSAPAKVLSHTAAFSVSFSPDGKTLASGSMHDSIMLWDYHQPSPAPTIIADPPWVKP